MTQPTAQLSDVRSDVSSETGSKSLQLDPQGPRSALTAPALPRVRADALSGALAGAELDDLRDHHLALAMAVIELASDAGTPFPWTHDDPTVALLRAAAKLSITAPDATSSAAADLVNQLGAAGSH